MRAVASADIKAQQALYSDVVTRLNRLEEKLEVLDRLVAQEAAKINNASDES